MLTWVSVLWHKHIEAEQVEGDNHPNAANFMEKLMALRTEIANLRSAQDFDREPDVTNGMLYLVVYALIMMVFAAYPFIFYTEWTHCVQLWSIMSAFLFVFTYLGLLEMQRILARSPFDPEGDCVNVDNLFCSMEETLFHMMRAGYSSSDDNCDTPVKVRSTLLWSRNAATPKVKDPVSASHSMLAVVVHDAPGDSNRSCSAPAAFEAWLP